MPEASGDAAARRRVLDEVDAMLRAVAGGPDRYYHSGKVDRVVGWREAVEHIREKLGEMRLRD